MQRELSTLVSDPDKRLLERLRQGEEAALGDLYALYFVSVKQLAVRLLGDPDDAEDVAQVAFTRVWQQRQRWSRKASPASILYRLTRNLAIDEHRRRRARRRRDFSFHLTGVPARPLTVPTPTEQGVLLADAMSLLPSRRRHVLRLTKLEGYSHREVASIRDHAADGSESRRIRRPGSTAGTGRSILFSGACEA